MFRDIRLASLRDSPQAFSATLESALARDEASWREGLAGRAQFVAMAADDVAGTAGGMVDASGHFGELVSMWVAPPWRGRGAGARLIEEVAGWAAAAGLKELRLWFVEGNEAAERSYLRSGFTRTGRRQPVRPGEPAMEVEMSRGL